MKISPVSSATSLPGVDGQALRVESVRNLKMTTNATPSPRSLPPEIAQELDKPDDKENNVEKPNAAIEVTEPLSPQFAALAKQRRALQVKERELLDREKAAEAKLQGGNFIDAARLKSEPLNVLLEAGVTYDQLTQAILANQGDPKVTALEAKIAALEQGVEKKLNEREARAEQQALAEMRREAERLVASSDDFELVRATRSLPLVMELIERTYRREGEVLDVTEATRLVEDHLFKENQKLLGLKKMQGLIKPPEQPAPLRNPGMRTLTNKDTASVPLTAKQRAIAAFYGTLKK